MWLSCIDDRMYALSMGGSRGGGGGQGVRTPLKIIKIWGLLAILIPLKNHKATKPAFNVRPSLARQRNTEWCFAGGPMMACLYSQISVIQTSINRNYLVIRRRQTVPTFFSIIYCNKTTDYSNFDYSKNSIFRSDSSVPIK